MVVIVLLVLMFFISALSLSVACLCSDDGYSSSAGGYSGDGSSCSSCSSCGGE